MTSKLMLSSSNVLLLKRDALSTLALDEGCCCRFSCTDFSGCFNVKNVDVTISGVGGGCNCSIANQTYTRAFDYIPSNQCCTHLADATGELWTCLGPWTTRPHRVWILIGNTTGDDTLANWIVAVYLAELHNTARDAGALFKVTGQAALDLITRLCNGEQVSVPFFAAEAASFTGCVLTEGAVSPDCDYSSATCLIRVY